MWYSLGQLIESLPVDVTLADLSLFTKGDIRFKQNEFLKLIVAIKGEIQRRVNDKAKKERYDV